MSTTPAHPFLSSQEALEQGLDTFAEDICGSLQSGFMVMPRGDGFLDPIAFQRGYEALSGHTRSFREVTEEAVLNALETCPLSLIVFRSILGFTPSEWAYMATQRTGTIVTEQFARGLDRHIRLNPDSPVRMTSGTENGVKSLIKAGCELIHHAPNEITQDGLHRLDKFDTASGADGLFSASQAGVPYAMVLYERFLGRPFAGHRDSVSEVIGDHLESLVQKRLSSAGIPFYRTKKAERVQGFDQAPDFLVPDKFHPSAVIEAKMCEDSGTARDKITRVQHLSEISMQGVDVPKFEVIACIDGRGFSVRRQDIKKLILACRGKVFTTKTLGQMVDNTVLNRYKN